MSPTTRDVRNIASGLRFPEGPIAMHDGSVLLVEIERGTLTRVEPNGATSIVANTGGGPNGAAIGPDGAVYICNNGGFTWVENERACSPLCKSPPHTREGSSSASISRPARSEPS